MQILDKNKLDLLEAAIIDAGNYAVEMQSHVHRFFKEDGSVLTEVDTEISHRIISTISELFPDCGIISEEEFTERKEDADYIFVLDPIDGTDVFSQGLPTFAVSLGILDKNRKPVGAMINAPRFGIGKPGLFIRLDPFGKLFVDGEEFHIKSNKDIIHQITMSSKGQKAMDFSDFRGKTRILGSTILHLVCPVVLEDFQGSVTQPCFVWDVASAHAVLLWAGMDMEHADGKPFEYDDEFVIERRPFKTPVYAGSEYVRNELKRTLPIRV